MKVSILYNDPLQYTKDRIWDDGVTDIESCINYHIELNTNIYDNTNSILNKWNYDKYYNKLFDNNFEYNFDRNKYKNMAEWLEIW